MIINILEGRILRKIYHSVEENRFWRTIYIYCLAREADVAVMMEVARMRWLGNVFIRMDEAVALKRILFAESRGHRQAERPNDDGWIGLVLESANQQPKTETNSGQLLKKPRLTPGCWAADDMPNL
jgi:hypothetical protein